MIESPAMKRTNPTFFSVVSMAVVTLAISLTTCPAATAQTLKEELCDCSPEITLILRTSNVRRVATLVGKAGGKVLYDPNLGIGNDIPFLVVTLPPAKMIDKKFIESLQLPAGAMQELAPRPIAPAEKQQPPVTNISLKSLSVPIDDIKIPELRKRIPGKGLGEDTVVAIIDTGIDASHPVFQDRVAYWYDATREGRTILKRVRQLDGKIEIADGKLVAVPPKFKENDYVYFGIIDEKMLGIQDSDGELTAGKQGFDVNKNGVRTDKFLVIVSSIEVPVKEDPADKKDADKKDADKKDGDKKDGDKKDADKKDGDKKDGDKKDDDKKDDDKKDDDKKDDDKKDDDKKDDDKKDGDKKDDDGKKKDDDDDDDDDEKAKGKKVEEKKAGEKKEEKAEAKSAEAKKPAAPKTRTLWVAYFDSNADQKIAGDELKTSILDFNAARNSDDDDGKEILEMLKFPSRTKTISYPLLFEANTKKQVPDITIAFDENGHGTHVGGIVAGNGVEIEGAAPKAKLMALKVCSGRSCTDMAIVRGLVMAFYNKQNIVPDVVNISLGSQEQFVKPSVSLLLQDLAAKFGTTFFISASNSGPGYRSINGLATSSPTVYVGAHASAKTLQQHYALKEGVPTREHGLLFFSSVGPSFTGELRPNIVAPGSALSSLPLDGRGAGMYNGTSMSSPIAAGAAAAMLSLAKQSKEYAPVEEWRQKKIAAVRKKELGTPYSITSIPLAVRTSLEDTATAMPDFTFAQQGYGLIDIDAAYEALIELAPKTLEVENRLVEFEINGNSKAGRLYERNNSISRHKQVFLKMNVDGEVGQDDKLVLTNTPVEVRLDGIQVQPTDGSVEDLDVSGNDLPFSIAQPGKEGDQGTSATVVMNNAVKSSFVSTRRVELMEAGSIYIAKYGLYQNGQRLFTILDVVHRPIELSDISKEISLVGISLQDSNRKAAHVVADQEIEAYQFHRYPVAVTSRDSSVAVTVGFTPEGAGRLLISAYDPDGNEMGFKIIRKTGQLGGDAPTATLRVSTREKQGVYEFIVASYSGVWPSGSNYDMLIEAQRFRQSTERVKLSTADSSAKTAPTEQIVTFSNSSQQVNRVSASLSGLTHVVAVNAPLLANHRTFTKLEIPKYRNGSGESKTATVVVSLPSEKKYTKAFFGRIDHQLYRRKPDGSFSVAYKGKGHGAMKMFTAVARPEIDKPFDPLYFGVETWMNIPEDTTVKQTQGTQRIEIAFPGLPVKLSNSPSVSILKAGQPNVFLLKLTSPKRIVDTSKAPASTSATPGTATLELPNGEKLKIPVSADAKATPPTKQSVRGVLSITTNDDNIKTSIPVEISQ
jgi:subtilisin family serine protease